MGKGLDEALLPIAGLAAIALTGGAATPAVAGAAGAGAGAGAAGLGAAGLASTGGAGLAGGALAAQGAAGLLGGAGAAAAGYGGLGSLGAGSLAGVGAADAAATTLPEGLATYGTNNEFIGSTIANDGFTANSFTGGYDGLNGIERVGQQLGGLNFDGDGIKTAQKGLKLLQGDQQQPQQQGQTPAPLVQPRPQQPTGSFLDSSNISPLELEELEKRRWLQGLGSPNA